MSHTQLTVDDALADICLSIQTINAVLVALIRSAPHQDILATRFAEIESKIASESTERPTPLSDATRQLLRAEMGPR